MYIYNNNRVVVVVVVFEVWTMQNEAATVRSQN